MFGRKKKQEVDTVDEAVITDAIDDLDDEVETEAEEVDTDEVDEWDELDASRDWRDDGPFDIDEVELDEDAVARIDFGSLIITPDPEMQLNVQADQASQLVHSILTIKGNSALEVAVFAAPASGGLARETRRSIAQQTIAAGGIATFQEGPFGTELKREFVVVDEDGRKGLHLSHMWLAEGPRWMVRGILAGEAAIPGNDDIAHAFEEFFRNVIVRRGRSAHAPGELIAMTLPESFTPT
ncbi:MAG: DUF3710 domain-containing protein, partial [Propionibacteriaceae bacterium]